MKYKRLLIPLFIVVLLVSFLFPASANESVMTLYDAFNYNGYLGSFYAIEAGSEEQIPMYDYEWIDNNILFIDNFTGEESYSAIAFFGRSSPTNSEAPSFLGFTQNDTIVMSAQKLVFSNVGDYFNDINASNCRVDVYGRFVNSSGTSVPLLMYTAPANFVRDVGTNGQYGIFDIDYSFSFEYTPAGEYVKMDAWSIILNFPEAPTSDVNWDDNVTLSAESFSFYVGDPDHAPIYSGPNTESVDDMKGAEDQLFSDTSDGRDEVNSIFDNALAALSSTSAMMQGAMALSAVISSIIAKLGLSPLLYASLALGMVAFILGMSQMIISSRKSGSSVTKNKGGGK